MWTRCGRAANHRATAMERIRAAVVGDHRDGATSSASLMQSRINGWRRRRRAPLQHGGRREPARRRPARAPARRTGWRRGAGDLTVECDLVRARRVTFWLRCRGQLGRLVARHKGSRHLMLRERSQSPSALACESSRRVEVAPVPSNPRMRKSTARRLGVHSARPPARGFRGGASMPISWSGCRRRRAGWYR
jgi:hypothetical protein